MPNKNMPDKVFVSHAKDDQPLVKAFQRVLDAIGLTDDQVFCSSLPGLNIPSGRDFKAHILEEIISADVAVMLITSNFYASAFCLCEMGAFWALGKKQIPIVVPPFPLGELEAVLKGVESRRLIEDLDQIAGELLSHVADQKGAFARWNNQREELLELVTKAAAALPIPEVEQAVNSNTERLSALDPRIGIVIEKEEKGLSRTGIKVRNLGGSEVRNLRLKPFAVAGKLVSFEENIPIIVAGESSPTIYPIVERGGHNLVHQMFQDYLRRNEKPEKITYAAEATYEDYKGVEYCAQWNYEFYPMKKVLTERGSTHTSLLTVSSVQTRKRASTRDESGKAS